MLTKEELINKIDNTIMMKWNWYNTGNTYLSYSIHSWLHDLLRDVFTDIYKEIENIKDNL